MAEDRNDTPWQQGFILSDATAAQLGLLPPGGNDDVLVVLISHDCDLLEGSATDPNCEVIVGRKIEAIDGNYANAKNPRRLHLRFSGGRTQISVELLAANKKFVKKADLICQPTIDDVRLTVRIR
jgi:hypothetical protein